MTLARVSLRLADGRADDLERPDADERGDGADPGSADGGDYVERPALEATMSAIAAAAMSSKGTPMTNHSVPTKAETLMSVPKKRE
jgi:hypothetical protein